MRCEVLQRPFTGGLEKKLQWYSPLLGKEEFGMVQSFHGGFYCKVLVMVQPCTGGFHCETEGLEK